MTAPCEHEQPADSCTQCVFSDMVDARQWGVAMEKRAKDAEAKVAALIEAITETFPHLKHPCETEELPCLRHCSGCQHEAYLRKVLRENE